VKNRFQNLPFKCNLQRYVAAAQSREKQLRDALATARAKEEVLKQQLAREDAVGRCRLNQVDP
jgi:hypothetical protein